MIEHMHGLGCDFSRKYKTVDLLYYEQYQYANEAIAREKQFKGWSRKKKLFIIRTKNQDLKTLNQELFTDHGYLDKDITEILVWLREKYRKNINVS
jgi:putative endonuclease